MNIGPTPLPWTPHHSMPECVTFKGEHGTENVLTENPDGYYCFRSAEDAATVAKAMNNYGDLVKALQELTPAMPPKDAPCHNGIVDQSACAHCKRVAFAIAALQKVGEA